MTYAKLNFMEIEPFDNSTVCKQMTDVYWIVDHT